MSNLNFKAANESMWGFVEDMLYWAQYHTLAYKFKVLIWLMTDECSVQST